MKALVIMVNRCQPAYLGCYGNDWLATPALDELAADSVVFDQHFADSVSPRGARQSWRLGRYAGGRGPGLSRLLWDAGVRTVLIGDERSPSLTGSPRSPSRSRRFAAGWEEQHWIRRERLPELDQKTLLGGAVQTAMGWVPAHRDADRWLLWLELSALQPPWNPADHDAEALEGLEEARLTPWFDPPAGRVGQEINSEDAERLSPTYAGVVSSVDQWLGTFLGSLKQFGLYEELLVMLTSDCGLPLGEHDLVGDPEPCPYEEQVHLPLLMHLPGNAQAGRRVQQLTQSVDLLPTLLEAFGVSVPDDVQGKSLLAAARGEPIKLREYACATAGGPADRIASIRTHQWHLIVPAGTQESRAPQLFIKPDDRWDMNEVSAQHPDVAEHLELALRRFEAAARAGRLDALPGLRG